MSSMSKMTPEPAHMKNTEAPDPLRANPTHAAHVGEAHAAHPGVPQSGVPKMRASRVNFYYGAFKALHDISLEFMTNKVTALIGPSGCGKSTFLRTLNRMNETLRDTRRRRRDHCSTGRTFSIRTSPAIRRRVGMVFQRPNPFPKSIFDNVTYGRRSTECCRRNNAAGTGGEEPAAGRAVGRSERQAAPIRVRALRRTAAAAVHCARAGG